MKESMNDLMCIVDELLMCRALCSWGIDQLSARN